MIVIAAACLGALVGGLTAYRRKGARLDIAHYAVTYALAFAIIGLFTTVFIDRMS